MIRRMLWQEFGIPSTDLGPADLLRIVDFKNAEAQRDRKA